MTAPCEVIGVDLGNATRNVRPEGALSQIDAAGRSPLTIEEGLALFAAAPSVIAPNRGFSLAGSSRGDPPRAGAVGEQRATEARMVLSRRTAHLAGHCLV